MSGDAAKSETMSHVLDWSFLIIDLVKEYAERYRKDIVKLLHIDHIYIKKIWYNLKIMASYSELVR